MPSLSIIKLGGSVLKRRSDYSRAARFARGRLEANPDDRLILVVSAAFGHTDRLERLARSCTPSPQQRTLDLLWSVGERTSVACLTLCLQNLGVEAVGLDIQETGLVLKPRQRSLAFDGRRLQRELKRCRTVVVPGFFASGRNRAVASLGRGGSDLSAVVLAAFLGVGICELIKDVSGYYDRDPRNDPHARPLPHLTYQEALRMAQADSSPVHPSAVVAAWAAGVVLRVRSLQSPHPSTVLGEGPARGSRRISYAVCH